MEKRLSSDQAENARQNLILMRRRLKLSQRMFIDKYLIDSEGKCLFSVSTMSAIENGSNRNLMLTVSAAAKAIDVDKHVFFLPPEDFSAQMEDFFRKEASCAKLSAEGVSELIKKTGTVESVIRMVSDYITDGILSGEMKPGDKLPSDRDLAVRFDVSRSAMREAMKVLSTMGLVNILHGQGTFIARDDTNFFLAPLSWTFLLGDRNTRSIIMVRNALECVSAGEAAKKCASGEDFSSLRMVYEKSCDSVMRQDFEAFTDDDAAFHLTIAGLCGNTIIASLLQTISRITKYISSTGLITLQQMTDSHKEHKEVYDAIMAGSPERARAAMAGHIHNAATRYKD